MKKLLIGLVFLTVTFISGNAISYAAWGDAPRQHAHPYFHYHDHPHFGVHVHNFYRDEYFPVMVGGTRYYYDDGVYYNYTGGDYVVVAPPMGAVVSAVPSDFQPVVINGTTYYTDNGTYYVSTPRGYKVVSQPQVQEAIATQNSVVVNVPREKGGYVAINLRRSGNGYVGPQGEFYANFPNVSDLRVVYGR